MVGAAGIEPTCWLVSLVSNNPRAATPTLQSPFLHRAENVSPESIEFISSREPICKAR